MHLIKLRLKQFRRFAAEQSLDLNEDLIPRPNGCRRSSNASTSVTHSTSRSPFAEDLKASYGREVYLAFRSDQ